MQLCLRPRRRPVPSRRMWPVAEVALPGRGTGLVAARDIQAGETVLSEAPCLLFVQPGFAASTCAQCLRTLAAGADGEVVCAPGKSCSCALKRGCAIAIAARGRAVGFVQRLQQQVRRVLCCAVDALRAERARVL